MKKISFVFLLLAAQLSNAQENNFTVSGKIKGLDSKQMFFITRDVNLKGGFKRDTIFINNESFSFSSYIKGYTFISLSPGVESVMKRTGKGYFPAKSSTLQFIAFPGASVTFSGEITDYVNAYPAGDEANNDLAALNKMVYPLMNNSVNLELKIANNLVTDSIEVKKLKKTINELDEKVIEMKERFVADHTSSVAAIWVLSDMMLRSQVSNKTAIELFGKMNKEKLVDIPFYTEVAKRVDGISSTGVGKAAPMISSENTYDRKRFDLASLKGKYVVIDFWGTWCGPCVAGMPMMKKYLEKYKDKMDIVGVAQESDNGDRWRKFLSENPGYQWHHVLSRDDENYILKYNVAGFPTKIIIDPLGNIAGRYVGEDDAIYKKLDELLK